MEKMCKNKPGRKRDGNNDRAADHPQDKSKRNTHDVENYDVFEPKRIEKIEREVVTPLTRANALPRAKPPMSARTERSINAMMADDRDNARPTQWDAYTCRMRLIGATIHKIIQQVYWRRRAANMMKASATVPNNLTFVNSRTKRMAAKETGSDPLFGSHGEQKDILPVSHIFKIMSTCPWCTERIA